MKKKELLAQLIKVGTIEKHMGEWYLTLTKEKVYQTAVYLLSQGMFTTTLEIKKHLRESGYWALQQTVSDAMDDLAQAGVVSYADNGTFRHYFK